MNILIADDSPSIRTILEKNLCKVPDFKIVASVGDGKSALELARKLRPDVIISDIDMPVMDGIEVAEKALVELRIPVLILSEDSGAYVYVRIAGASEFVVKPDISGFDDDFFRDFVLTLRSIAEPYSPNPLKHPSYAMSAMTGSGGRLAPELQHGYKVLCIGASTGGPVAVADVLAGLGENFPLPVLYVQHIESRADQQLASWLTSTCGNITVQLAKDGEEALAGRVYMSPGGKHLVIDHVQKNGNPVLHLTDDPPERFLKPAVNKLFRSAASLYQKSCLAVLLTGMGRDGSEGCRSIRNAGGYTIAEDKSTCAVFGMPAAAIEIGGASEVLPREEIAARIRRLVSV